MSFLRFFRRQWNPDRSPGSHYPMRLLNGAVVGSWQQGKYGQRLPPTEDYDFTQRQFRRYVNASGGQDVQLPSGLESGKWKGHRLPYRGAGWLFTVQPRIPGQTRGMYGGFYPREPSAAQMQAIIQATAGAQPQTPAGTSGPGGIAGEHFLNPMTG